MVSACLRVWLRMKDNGWVLDLLEAAARLKAAGLYVLGHGAEIPLTWNAARLFPSSLCSVAVNYVEMSRSC